MKNIFTFGARVYLAIIVVVLSAGCGGGSCPVTPDQPFEYRLQAYDGPNGGKVVDRIDVPQGEKTWIWVQLQSRAIINGTSGPWGPVTSEEMMDVTVKGIPSGDDPVDLGALPAQCRLKAGAEQRLEFWPPLGGHGGATVVVLSVPTREGAWLGLTVTVVGPSGNPPPVNICGYDHPEAIDGYWYDCLPDGNGGFVWGNTGIPVQTCNEERRVIDGYWWECQDIGDGYGGKMFKNTGIPANPPTGNFHAHGNFGTLDSEGTLHIMKGRAEIVQLFVGDVAVDPQHVTAELPPSLPKWLWLPTTSEISTVYTLGNPVYIPEGEYTFSLWYEDLKMVIHLVVDHNPELG